MRFNIKKGKYSSSGIHIGFQFGRVSQTYEVRFDSSCLYEDIDWERDWNKLAGWSYTNLPVKWEKGFSANPDFKFGGVDYIWGHHFNSNRLVWRSNKSKGVIELGFYYYQDGIRTIVELGEVPVNQVVRISITSISLVVNSDNPDINLNQLLLRLVVSSLSSFLLLLNSISHSLNLFNLNPKILWCRIRSSKIRIQFIRPYSFKRMK